MQVRIARHTSRLSALVGFYRDGLGLRELGRFENHDGYEGVFLDLPGTQAHLEFTSGGTDAPPDPHDETLLVLYLGDEKAVSETSRRAGATRVVPANPYWRRHGVSLLDPDGFQVVLVPETWSERA
jgi:catechol 2,3-dioxygenase-like lactoylglutathione lyase family enzyme